MLKKYPQFSFGFAIVFAFELIAEANNIRWLIYMTKPLIIVLLMLFLYKSVKHRGRFSKRVFIALGFSFIGDVLLMFVYRGKFYFLGGLLAFLIAHIFYILAFYTDYIKKENVNRSYIWSAIMFFGIYCISFYVFLHPHLGNFKVPVLAYSLVISAMAIAAVSRINKVSSTSFKLIFFGALFFVISDSLLAYFKFVYRFEYSAIAVMATYMIAQYLIIMGAVERRFLKKD